MTSATPHQTRLPRLGIQLNNWQREMNLREAAWEKLDAALAQLVEAGFAGAEVPNWTVPDLKDPVRLCDVMARRGVTFISMHTGGAFFDPVAYRERVLTQGRVVAECAAAAGAAALVVSGSSKRPRDPAARVADRELAEAWRTQAQNLTEFGRLVRDLGLRMDYHNHDVQFVAGAAEMESILEVDPALLSLCVDVGHAAQSMPQEQLLPWLNRHWDRIGSLHYKDIDADRRIVEAIGDGVIDYGAVTALARTHGFTGWLVAELEAGPGARRAPLEDARLSATAMKRGLHR